MCAPTSNKDDAAQIAAFESAAVSVHETLFYARKAMIAFDEARHKGLRLSADYERDFVAPGRSLDLEATMHYLMRLRDDYDEIEWTAGDVSRAFQDAKESLTELETLVIDAAKSEGQLHPESGLTSTGRDPST